MLLIVLLLHSIFLINTMFTLWPEMVVYPYLLNHGYRLYQDVVNPYPPLLTSALSLFSKFAGYQPLHYQLLTWLIILILDIEIYLITRVIFKKKIFALISTLFFSVFSIPFAVNGLWFDLVQTPFIMLSVFFAWKFFETGSKKHLFYSFFLLTITFFIKQQILILFFWFFVVIIFKFRKKSVKILINPIFYLPFLVLLCLFILIFYTNRSAEAFLYWAFYSPFTAVHIPGYILLPNLRQFLVIASIVILFTPALFGKFRLIPLTALISILFVYPRFDYFHMIPALAIFSISAGFNFSKIPSLKTPQKLFIFLAFVLLSIFTLRYFSNNFSKETRFFDREIYTSAAFLKQITDPGETLYIQNGPDQLLPITGLLPPKPWADEFPWYLEREGMQEKIIDGLKLQNPKYLIYKPYDSKDGYEIGSYRPQKLADYLDSNYSNVIQISQNLWLKGKK